MNPTTELHNLGQSLWLDNITRDLLVRGTLQRYVRDFAVSGLTSNPTIFDHAIRNTNLYDDAIRDASARGRSGEALFLDLALEDVTEAADLFRPIHDATAGIDGWASLEVSPLLADDAAATVRETVQLHARARRPNLFIKIPGTRAGVTAIEESIFARRAGQRHVAVLARTVRRRGRRLHACCGAAHCCGPRPKGRLGRVNLRQPLGRGGQRHSAARAAQPPRHCHRKAHLQSLPRVAGLAALAQARSRRRTAATPTVGQHREQGSAERPTRCTSRRWRRRTRSTPCPTRRCSPSRITARCAANCLRMVATLKRRSPNSLEQGVDMPR